MDNINLTRISAQGYMGAGVLVHELLHARKCVENKGKSNKDGASEDELDVQRRTDEVMADCGHCQGLCAPPIWKPKGAGKAGVLYVRLR